MMWLHGIKYLTASQSLRGSTLHPQISWLGKGADEGFLHVGVWKEIGTECLHLYICIKIPESQSNILFQVSLKCSNI